MGAKVAELYLGRNDLLSNDHRQPNSVYKHLEE